MTQEPDITTTTSSAASDPQPDSEPGPGRPGPGSATLLLPGRRSTGGDAVFRWLAKGAGLLILLVIAAIAAFLIYEAIPAVAKDHGNFFGTQIWDPDNVVVSQQVFGIAAIAFGSVLTSVLALLIGVPIAVGVALFLSHYAPPALARPLAYLVDLLAAVPSVVFGLWGLLYLSPAMIPLSKFLSKYLGWFPLFTSTNQTFGRSMLVASVVLAVMMLPIVAALSREVFVQAPRDHVEAAFALGATKWEMIRLSVLPYGRSGVISAIVLGFGRAIGETIAVALVLSQSFHISWRILDPAGNTIAANVATKWGDAAEVGRGALIASGLVLFAITLVVNFGARAIVRRGQREKKA